MQNIYIKNSIVIVLPVEKFSEEEYLIAKKIFEKAGKSVFVAADSNTICSGDNGLKVGTDTNFFNINEKNFAAIVLIGGKGIDIYKDNHSLHRIVNSFHKFGKVVAAICRAPVVLANAGLLTNISATCWPENKNELIALGIDYQDKKIVKAGNIITAEGPRSAEQFAETILNMIK